MLPVQNGHKKTSISNTRIQWALALNEWPQKCESLNKVIMAQTNNREISRTQENGDSFMLIVAIIGYDMISFNNEKRKGNCFYLVLCDCQS